MKVARRAWVEEGGLVSFGAIREVRLGAVLVDQILRGAEPADLPVEQPTKFELVINGKTAKGARTDDPAVAAAAG